jgi:hypothetical protein
LCTQPGRSLKAGQILTNSSHPATVGSAFTKVSCEIPGLPSGKTRESSITAQREKTEVNT